MNLDKDSIKKIIPHREPFLFVDSINIIEKGVEGVGSVVFKKESYFFEGHFPNNPIVPGVIIVEALAQTAGVVSGLEFEKENRSVLFMSINSVKFRKPLLPEETLYLNVKKLNQVKNAYKFSGIAKKTDQTVITESTFTAMII